MRCEKPECVCHCTVCGKQTNNLTCSMECAGVLSHSQRQANKLRKEFNTSEKQKIREYIWNYIKKLHNKHVKNQNAIDKTINVIDFWGGGLFPDFILEKIKCAYVKNQGNISINLFELEKSKKLHPALEKYKRQKNHNVHVKNQGQVVKIIPFFGNLKQFSKVKTSIKNHNDISFDVIWLDYCSTIINIKQDIKALKNLVNNDTVILITLFEGNDGTFNRTGRIDMLDNYINTYLPYFERRKFFKVFKKRKGTYIYKIPSYIKQAIPKS